MDEHIDKGNRAKNLASLEDVAKIIRCNLQGLDNAKLAIVDMDCLVAAFSSFLLDLAIKTPRISDKVLQKAAMLALSGVTSSECLLFGQRMAAAMQYCRHKMKSFTSGAKLHPMVFKIGKAVVAHAEVEQPAMSGKRAAESIIRTPAKNQKVQPFGRGFPRSSSSATKLICLAILSLKISITKQISSLGRY